MPTTPTQILVHADESCLGNGREPPNRGGNAALVEVPAGDSVARWDVFECSPDTTNQRMALAGAIVALEWVHRQWQGADIRYVSDSEYLIKGMSAWVSDWEARGWRRKGGPIENLGALAQTRASGAEPSDHVALGAGPCRTPQERVRQLPRAARG